MEVVSMRKNKKSERVNVLGRNPVLARVLKVWSESDVPLDVFLLRAAEYELEREASWGMRESFKGDAAARIIEAAIADHEAQIAIDPQGFHVQWHRDHITGHQRRLDGRPTKTIEEYARESGLT
jgi:hypothetical protein